MKNKFFSYTASLCGPEEHVSRVSHSCLQPLFDCARSHSLLYICTSQKNPLGLMLNINQEDYFMYKTYQITFPLCFCQDSLPYTKACPLC
jgi:hypothetical protein